MGGISTRSSHPIGSRPAVAAMRQSRCEPAPRNGEAVTIRVTVEMSFTLKDYRRLRRSGDWRRSVRPALPDRDDGRRGHK
ncbi:MAG: energy transducer TonB [Vicinamibacterales bacterium]